MKYTFILLGVVLLVGSSAPAQFETRLRSHYWNDSLFYVMDTNIPGSGAFYDFEDFGGNRFDATGDGIDELFIVQRNESDLVSVMRVIEYQDGNDLFAIDFEFIRQRLVSHDGFTPEDANTLKFRGFSQWTSGASGFPSGRVPLFTAKGAPVIYDPSNQLVLALHPDQWRLLGIADFDGDGWLDIVLGDRSNKIIEVHGSRYSPSFAD